MILQCVADLFQNLTLLDGAEAFASVETCLREAYFDFYAQGVVDVSRNTLGAATTGETTDSWLRHSLHVVTQDFAICILLALSKDLVSW